MSVVNEVHAGALAVANPAAAAQQAKVPFWRWPRLYRYGFLAFILIIW